MVTKKTTAKPVEVEPVVPAPFYEEDAHAEDLGRQLLEAREENKALLREVKAQRAEVLKVRVDAEQARVAALNEKDALLEELEEKTAEVFRTKTEAEQTLLSTQSENERLAAELKRKTSEITRYVQDTNQTITGLENLDKARLKDIKAKLDTIAELKDEVEKVRTEAGYEKLALQREIEQRENDILKIQADADKALLEAATEKDEAETAKSELKTALRDDYSVVGYKRVLKMIAEADVQYIWNGFEFGHAILNKRGEWLGAAGPVFQSAARLILEDPSSEVTWDLPREAYSK